MLLSMTGFGRCSKTVDGRLLTVEVRGVNHRYFEYQSRLPRSFSFVDDKIKNYISGRVSRGKVDLLLFSHSMDTPDSKVLLNIPLAESYLDAFSELSQKLCIDNDITVQNFVNIPDIFTITKLSVDEDKIFADILSVLTPAVDDFIKMRQLEGSKLCEDIKLRLQSIQTAALAIEEGGAQRQKEYTQKLFVRLEKLLCDTTIDEGRILTEAAIFADKTSVSEETVRIASHIKQFLDIMHSDGSVGRKLDFLTQELNREVNTIGSKIQDTRQTMLVVEMKADIERIREQIQNVE